MEITSMVLVYRDSCYDMDTSKSKHQEGSRYMYYTPFGTDNSAKSPVSVPALRPRSSTGYTAGYDTDHRVVLCCTE
eukprot:6207811-Pleurochrysis_carterae.AAC.3